ncbi:hypothetical protein RJ035_007162 [Blastomyces gilchristii]
MSGNLIVKNDTNSRSSSSLYKRKNYFLDANTIIKTGRSKKVFKKLSPAELQEYLGHPQGDGANGHGAQGSSSSGYDGTNKTLDVRPPPLGKHISSSELGNIGTAIMENPKEAPAD